MNYALFATGLTLIFGIMNVINLAHGELFMLGAVLVYILMTYLGINYFLAGIISVTTISGFGFLLNRIAIQPLVTKSPFTILLSTIAMSMIILHGTLAVMGPTGHLISTPISGMVRMGPINLRTEGIMLFSVGLIAIISVYLFLERAKIGKDMQATIQNPVGAKLCGINTTRVYDYTVIMASGLAALGGILNSALYTADPVMGQNILIKGFAIVIVAGLGNLLGATILGIVIGVTEMLFSFFISAFFREVMVYGIMVLVLLLKPEGLFSKRE
jgi:branched-chain amino acid transport system permease protein